MGQNKSSLGGAGRTLARVAVAAGVASVWAGVGLAGTIVDTGLGNGWFGFVGYDLYTGQSVALGFTPQTTCTLDDVGVWIMSNDFDAPGRTFTLTLRESMPGSNNGIPSASVIESWDVATSAVGWTPVLETVNSVLHPTLSAGVQYFIVAESTEPAGYDPCWVQGNNEDPFVVAIDNEFNPNGWESGLQYGSAPGTVINATPVPVPGAMAMFGIAGAGAMRRRRGV